VELLDCRKGKSSMNCHEAGLHTVPRTLAALLKRCSIVARESLPQTVMRRGLHTITRMLAALLRWRFWIGTRESLSRTAAMRWCLPTVMRTLVALSR
jgi:hypothetical protein